MCVCDFVYSMCVLSSLDKGSAALLLWVEMKLSLQPLRLTVPPYSLFCETILATKFVLNYAFGLCTLPLPFDAPH